MQSNLLKSSIIHNWKNIPEIKGYVALGNFDGVHLGHQKLLSKGIDIADISVLTYIPHPLVILKKKEKPFLLTTDEEKRELLQEFDLKNILFLEFDKKLLNMTARDFVNKILVNRLNPDGVLVGYDHNFGKNREGNIEYLKEMSKKYNFDLIIQKKIMMEGITIKSSKIRDYIRDGNIEKANKMLNHPFSISGKVIPGDGLGSKIDYPTANLKIKSKYKLLPPEGVYSAKVEIEDKNYPAMLYIGSSPTYKIPKKKIEVHILEFSGDLYDIKLTCNIYSKIRDKRNFSSKEKLKNSLDRNKHEIINNLKEVSKWDFQPRKNRK